MNVVTIKWGSRYPSGYVNELFGAVQRTGWDDLQFYCFTDDSSNLDKGIQALPLPDIDLPEKYQWTFWRKLALFDPALGLKGACLYFDLDVVITGDLRLLTQGWSGRPRFIKNWVGAKTSARSHFDRINSSVVLYDGAACGVVLERFYQDRDAVLARYPGDQGFLYDCMADNAEFFDDGLCVSFKRHCIPRFPLNFVYSPKVPKGASVVVFHGKPDPHEASKGYRRGRWKNWCRPVPWVPYIR